jgi:gliding motility-associated-like protein
MKKIFKITALVVQMLWLHQTKLAAQCAQIIDPQIVCDSGQYAMKFQVKNNSTWLMKGLTIKNLNPNIKPVSTVSNGGFPFFDIPDIPAGTTCSTITIPMYVPIYDTITCFNFTFCDVNSPTTPSANCCTIDSICIEIQKCQGSGGTGGPGQCVEPCDGLTEITYKYADSTEACCFKLSFVNKYLAANIGKIEFTGIGGTEFAVTTTSGWTYGGISTANYRELLSPIGGVGMGTYSDFIKMCVTSANPAPHIVEVRYTDVNGFCMCLDTLKFSQCTVVEASCATFVNDSIFCKDGKTLIKFNIKNNSSFPIRQLDFFIDDTTHFVYKEKNIQLEPSQAIAVGATAGPYTIEIDTLNGGASQFCLQVSAHDNTYTQNSFATTCCSDAIRKICLPFLNCKSDECCDFMHITIPNGVTPNGDKANDLWDLITPATCDSIHITIINRWGNIVFEDKNYLNTWDGKNQNGQLLPVGTYFAIIELKNGSKKSLYIDLRY